MSIPCDTISYQNLGHFFRQMRLDYELVQDINSGGTAFEKAWADLCDKYQKLVFHIIHNDFSALRDDAEDLCQEVFYRLFKNIQGLELSPGEDLIPIVRTYLRNLCIDEIRKRRGATIVDIELEAIPGVFEETETASLNADVFEWLSKSFHLLGETCRKLIAERIYKETPYSDLEKTFKRTQGALRTQVNECKKSWMQIYGRLGGPEL
jgi:RNA polymerase sigma factor (sigma-70 family)